MIHPIVSDQRFFPVYLCDLVDYKSPAIQEYVRGQTNIFGIADKVIRDVIYPMHHGVPDDTHTWNAFHGRYCKTIIPDFWQMASETAIQRIGDCEDSSILFVSSARNLVNDTCVYEVFGLVRDAATKRILGGHGWSVARTDETSDFRLIESTLDNPPSFYPFVIPDIYKPFEFGGVIYDPQVIWNDKTYNEIGFYTGKGDTRAKYEAIERVWWITPKPLKLMRKRSNRVKRAIFLTYRRV